MAHLVLARTSRYESKREVVANERRFRVEDDVEGFLNEELYKPAFTTHPYHWPTIGWMSDIEGFTTDDCRSVLSHLSTRPTTRRWWWSATFAKRTCWGDSGALWRAHARRHPHRRHSSRAAAARRAQRVAQKPTATDKLAVAYHGPAFGDVDHVPLTMLSEVLFSGRSSRCYRAIIQEAELATELRGWVGTFRDPGLFEIYATARPGKHLGRAHRGVGPAAR